MDSPCRLLAKRCLLDTYLLLTAPFRGMLFTRRGGPSCLTPKTHRVLGRIRARYLVARLPNPPVRPVRETFTSYGSRERDITGNVHFASSTEHSPWTALRVRWVPLYCFPTLSLRPFAMYVAFLRSDYYAQFDCLEGLGVSSGSPQSSFPPSFPSLAGSPVFTTEDSNKMG